MKYEVLVLLLALTGAQQAFCGDGANQRTAMPYYDALALANPGIALEAKKKLLEEYAGGPGWTKSRAKLANDLFLRDLLAMIDKSDASPAGSMEPAISVPLQPLSPAAGLDLAEEPSGSGAKADIRHPGEPAVGAFFEKFKEDFLDTGSADLQALFPLTANIMAGIGGDVSKYRAYLLPLRESFRKDFDRLIDNLPSIAANHREFFGARKDCEAVLMAGCGIAAALMDQQHPAEVLNGFPTAYLDEMKDWKGALQTLRLVSASLRDYEHSDQAVCWVSPSHQTVCWVGPSKIANLVEDSSIFKIYLGLLYQQASHYNNDTIRFGETDLCKMLNASAARFDLCYLPYKEYFLDIGDKTAVLTGMLGNLHNAGTDSAASARYYEYLNAVVSLLESMGGIGKLAPPDFLSPGPAIARFMRFANATLPSYFKQAYAGGASDFTLAKTFRKRAQDSLAVWLCAQGYRVNDEGKNVIRQFTAFADDNFPSFFQKARGLSRPDSSLRIELLSYADAGPLADYFGRTGGATAQFLKNSKDSLTGLFQAAYCAVRLAWDIKRHDYAPALITASSLYGMAYAKPSGQGEETMKSLKKYGPLIAAIAQANSPADIQGLNDVSGGGVAASSVPQQHGPFSIALNAYLGAFAGYEEIKGRDLPLNQGSHHRFNTCGLSLPMGIAARWDPDPWRLSLFGSLIDFGNFAAARYWDATMKQLPTIHKGDLRAIFAPGGFISAGLSDLPIRVNIGAEMGQNFRESITGSNNYGNSWYYRYSVALCTDIPLLYLYRE